ncbi:MAG: hypothetical protein CMP20_09355 [Rickettsiales bacterium]|nr:hypothetical protein [Rickettsiales bacterium]
MAATRLDNYIAMLLEGDNPMISCLGHGIAPTDNSKHEFYGVDLLCSLYIVTEENSDSAKLVECDFVDTFYIQEQDGDIMAHILVVFPDSDVIVPYKTSVSIWKQYAQRDNSLRLSHTNNIPGHFFVDWFAYSTQHNMMDMRYTEYRGVTITKNMPYLAGRQIKRNEVFARIVRHKHTSETYFYQNDTEGVTQTLIGVGLTPRWKLSIKPFAPKASKAVQTVAIALAFVPFLKDLFMTNNVAQTFLVDKIRSRETQPIRFIMLDLDAFVNNVFAPKCELCKNTMIKACVCETRNQYFETLDFVDKLHVVVSCEYTDLVGPLCQSAQALCGLLRPKDITVATYDDLPPLLAGEDFEDLLDSNKVPSTQRGRTHWTALASNGQEPLLTIRQPTPHDSDDKRLLPTHSESNRL